MLRPDLTVNGVNPGVAPLPEVPGLAHDGRLNYLATMVSRGALLLLVLAACGSSTPPPATHEHFRAIQRHEATLDRTRTPALEGDCPDACAATAEGCAASRRICAIAEPTSDVDAHLRCRNASERCAQYESATTRCACDG